MFHRTATHLGAPQSGGNPIAPGFCRRGSNPPNIPSGGAAPRGYWVLGYDGGLFAFGGAPFFGSVAGRLNGAAAVGMQASPSGNGYYILTNRGEIHPFGDATRARLDGGRAPERADHRTRTDTDGQRLLAARARRRRVQLRRRGVLRLDGWRCDSTRP